MVEWNTAPRILNPAPDGQAAVGKELTVRRELPVSVGLEAG